MWKSLPDDCVKNIMTYWSPLNAHQLRIYIFVENIKDELMQLRREYVNHYIMSNDEDKYDFIPYEQYKLYTNLWMKMIKNSKWISYVKEHGSKDFRGRDNLFKVALETDNVKITKKSIIIERIGNTPAYMGKKLKNIYMVDEDDFDWREAMNRYETCDCDTFAQDTYRRNMICKKVEQQRKTYIQMMQQVIMPLDLFIFDWTHKDKSKWYLWKYDRYKE